MPVFRYLLILFAFALAGSPLHAEPVDWLYDVQVPVSERTHIAAEQALPRCIEVLLMRLTGLANIPRVPEIQAAFLNLNTFVKQYEFTKIPVNSPLGSGDALVARFNSSLVRELIKEARFPVWPADRPTVLIWLSIHETFDSELVRDGTPVALKLRERALERGIELVLPIMDLQESATITSSSVVGRFWSDLANASVRYQADFVVAVACERDFFGRYQTNITYWYQAAEHFDHRVFPAREGIPGDVIDHIVNVLVKRHAIVRKHEEIHRIGVQDIANVASYAGVLRHLNDLDFVDDVVLVSLDNDILIFDVYTPSSAAMFVELVDATLELKKVELQEFKTEKKIMQLFSWVPQQ